MNKRKLLVAIAATVLLFAGIVGGMLADIQVSADGVVTINGHRILGGIAYVDELRATGSAGLKLRDDAGTGGITVTDNGVVTTTHGIQAGGVVTATGFDAGDANITNAGNIALDSITNDGNITTTITAANGPVLISQANAYDAFRVDDEASDASPFVIDQSGNVGIGTTGPGAKLDVNGDVRVSSGTAAGNGLTVGAVSGTYGNRIISDGNHLYIGIPLNYYIYFFDSTGAGKWWVDGSGNTIQTGNLTVQGTGNSSIAGNVGIGTTGPTTAATISGTLSIGANPTAPSAGNYLAIWGNATTTPTLGANTAAIFARDVGGTTELFSMDEAGNETQQTPHNFDLFEPDVDEAFPWSYYACNRYLGKCINVDIAGAIREIETLSGKQFVYYEDMPESEVLSWDEHQQAEAERANARRLAEAAAVLTPTIRANAVESYMQTVTQPVSPTQYITTTSVVYELDANTGLAVARTVTTTTEVMETVEVGLAWRLKAGCNLDSKAGVFKCPVGEANAVYEPYQPQEMPEWMQQRTIALFLAPQDVSGLEKPEGDWKKLTNVGAYAVWAGIGVETESALALHQTLWGMSPTQTLGALAVVQTRGTDFYDHRVQTAMGMTTAQALARRDRIANYLASRGKDVTLLRAATTEDAQIRGIANALGVTMDQLWSALE